MHIVREQPFQYELVVVNADAGNSPQQGGEGNGRIWGMGRKGDKIRGGGEWEERKNERRGRIEGREWEWSGIDLKCIYKESL